MTTPTIEDPQGRDRSRDLGRALRGGGIRRVVGAGGMTLAALGAGAATTAVVGGTIAGATGIGIPIAMVAIPTGLAIGAASAAVGGTGWLLRRSGRRARANRVQDAVPELSEGQARRVGRAGTFRRALGTVAVAGGVVAVAATGAIVVPAVVGLAGWASWWSGRRAQRRRAAEVARDRSLMSAMPLEFREPATGPEPASRGRSAPDADPEEAERAVRSGLRRGAVRRVVGGAAMAAGAVLAATVVGAPAGVAIGAGGWMLHGSGRRAAVRGLGEAGIDRRDARRVLRRGRGRRVVGGAALIGGLALSPMGIGLPIAAIGAAAYGSGRRASRRDAMSYIPRAAPYRRGPARPAAARATERNPGAAPQPGTTRRATTRPATV